MVCLTLKYQHCRGGWQVTQKISPLSTFTSSIRGTREMISVTCVRMRIFHLVYGSTRLFCVSSTYCTLPRLIAKTIISKFQHLFIPFRYCQQITEYTGIRAESPSAPVTVLFYPQVWWFRFLYIFAHFPSAHALTATVSGEPVRCALHLCGRKAVHHSSNCLSSNSTKESHTDYFN